MTMGELAAVLDDEYDESVVSQVEASTLSLSLDGLVHAARILSVSADYLLGLTAVPNAPVHLAPELADIVIIPGDRNYIGWDGDVEFVEVGLPFSATFLSFHGIDPARARAFRVAHSSVPGFIPHGAHIVVDYAGTELNEKNIYLASRHRSLELGRFRLDAAPYFWNSRRRETGRWRRNARGFNVVGMVCWSSTFFDRGETFIPDPDECEGDITMWERR